MNRRKFLQSTLAAAALGAITHLDNNAGVKAGESPAAGAAGVTRRPFKDGKIAVPLLGFGLMRLPQKGAEIDYAVAEKMVADAFAAGVNYFDTAYMYHGGRSEKFAGDVLSKYPRESYFLADKMPPWSVQNSGDLEKIFQEQLNRCKTSYFDFYLIHSLSADNWAHAQKFQIYEFLAKKKEEGKIRYLGFSFHDKPEVLQTIAAARPWDFAQIQLNYLDWELYRSREQYEILTKAGIPVIVMEPIRGGSLATLSPEAKAVYEKAAPGVSLAAWALRFAGSLPNVLTVLSGMSLPEHVADNIKTFTPFVPLTADERDTIAAALTAYRKCLAVPCTACRYCLPCPAGVDIPTIFAHYNQYKVSGNKRAFSDHYRQIDAAARAEACVSCGKCTKVCPQHLDIPGELKKIAAAAAEIAKELGR